MRVSPERARNLRALFSLDAGTCGGGVLLLGALCIVPFLQNRHFMPLPAFWTEWWALVLGCGLLLIASLGQWSIRRPVPLPPLIAPLMLLIVAVLVQWGLQRLPSLHLGVIYAGYLLLAAGMAVTARLAVERYGLPCVVDCAALALAMGGAASAVTAILQWQAQDVAWVFPLARGGRPYGNLAASNELAHYLSWGIASVAYLAAQRKCHWGLGFALASLLLFAAMLAQSRIVPLFVFLAPWVMLIGGLSTRTAASKRMLWLVASMVPMLLLFHFLIPLLTIGGSSLERLVAGVGERAADSTRLKEIGNALDVALTYPWLGGGAGSYPWLAFEIGGAKRGYISERAHNLPADLAAEFGFPVAVLVCGFLAWRWWALARQSDRVPEAWGALVATVTAIHSLVQYPLWYANFLVVFAFIVGATDPAVFHLHLQRRARIYFAIAGCIGLLAVFSAGRDYSRLERLATIGAPGAESNPLIWMDTKKDLARLASNSLMAPWGAMYLSVMIEPERDQVGNQSFICQRAMRLVAPGYELGVKCAMLLAIEGKQERALDLIQKLALIFPDERDAMLSQLNSQRVVFPEVLPLRERLLKVSTREATDFRKGW